MTEGEVVFIETLAGPNYGLFRRLPVHFEGNYVGSAYFHVTKLWRKLHEPPCTDPYARWCGRAKAAKPSSIPIEPKVLETKYVEKSISPPL